MSRFVHYYLVSEALVALRYTYFIIFIFYTNLGNRHSLYHGNNIIGTTTSRCDVTILDKSISDVHAVIKVDSNSMSLFDLR